MKIKNVLIVLFTLFIAVLVYLLSIVDQSKVLQKKIFDSSTSDFKNIQTITSGINGTNISSQFPFKKYLAERENASVNIIKWDKRMLDEQFPELSNENSRILSIAFTDSLFEKQKNVFLTYDPDYLINLFQWIESFRYAALIDQENEILYASIFDFWLNQITSNLDKYSSESVNIKYDFKYRYLESKCTEYGFTFGTKVSSLEKVIYNIVDSNWAHLFDASWNQSTILQKILFLILLMITIYGYVLVVKNVFLFFKSK
jgi:hypothetical protein